MMSQTAAPRRYLDNAATTWPKPPAVLDAWLAAARDLGATAGRAAYRDAVEADAIRSRARGAVARLLGGVDPLRVALPGGCTLALNLAIHGLLRSGGHAIATAADHNATLRPLHWLASHGLIELTVVPCDAAGRVDPAAIAAAWRADTRLAVLSHASNVTGAVQPVRAIADIAHERNGLLLLDAAQSLGQLACDVATLGADVVAAAGHKWLLGTAGVGILWARAGLDIETLVQGGTGSGSDSLDMPEAFTDRMEAGTPDVPALAALSAGIRWLEAESRKLRGRLGIRLRQRVWHRGGGGVRVRERVGGPGLR
jgi:selenocysteine lyase/cysteine desulfurase